MVYFSKSLVLNFNILMVQCGVRLELFRALFHGYLESVLIKNYL